MNQALPRNVFEILVSALGDRSKAEQFATGVESLVSEQEKRVKSEVKSEIKAELKDELITREIFLMHTQMVEDRFQMMDRTMIDKFKMVDEKFKILIGLVILFGTVLNPTLLNFLAKLLKIY